MIMHFQFLSSLLLFFYHYHSRPYGKCLHISCPVIQDFLLYFSRKHPLSSFMISMLAILTSILVLWMNYRILVAGILIVEKMFLVLAYMKLWALDEKTSASFLPSLFDSKFNTTSGNAYRPISFPANNKYHLNCWCNIFMWDMLVKKEHHVFP